MNDKTNKALEYVSALMDGEALTDEMLMPYWQTRRPCALGMRTTLSATVSVRVRQRVLSVKTMQTKHLQCLKPRLKANRKKYAQREAANSGFFKFLRPLPACVRLLLQYGNLPANFCDVCRLQRSNVQPAQNIIPVTVRLVIKQLRAWRNCCAKCGKRQQS